MSRAGVSLWVLVSVLLTGCIGDADEPAPAPTAAPAESDAPADPVVDAPSPPAEPTPRTTTVPVGASGTTSQGVWLCTEPHGTGGCQGQEVAGDGYTVHLVFEGTLVGAALNITWDALDPTLETMVVVHGVHTEDGTERFEPFESTSPVAIVLDDVAFGPDGMIYLALWPAAEAKTPAGAAFVDVQRQPFDVAGHVVQEQDA